MEYRLVDDDYTNKAGAWVQQNYKRKTLPEEAEKLDKLLFDIADGIKLPRDREVLYYWDRLKDTNKIVAQYPIVLMREVAIAGIDISKAWIGQDEYGGLAVHFTTTADGATKFADVTAKKNWGKKLAIVIDDKVRSAPRLNVQITSGQAMINGNFTYDEVNTLTRIIKEGALPVDLNIIEERTVGPSLGQDSIESGVKAAHPRHCGGHGLHDPLLQNGGPDRGYRAYPEHHIPGGHSFVARIYSDPPRHRRYHPYRRYGG